VKPFSNSKNCRIGSTCRKEKRIERGAKRKSLSFILFKKRDTLYDTPVQIGCCHGLINVWEMCLDRMALLGLIGWSPY
jgi:hypothetical protein